MAEHIEAGDVHRAERGALWSSERRAGDGVDVLDCQRAGFERPQHRDDTVQADAVGDEIRRVLRDHDALAEAAGRANSDTLATTAGSVSAVGMTSTSCR